MEYVELYNSGSQAVDLSGWSLEGGIDYVFPVGAVMPAGGYLLVALSPAPCSRSMAQRRLGPLAGKLSNEGDTLLLRDRDGTTIDELAYQLGFPWPTPRTTTADQSIGLINARRSTTPCPAPGVQGAPTPGGANAGSPATRRRLSPTSAMPAAVTPHSWDTVTMQAHVRTPMAWPPCASGCRACCPAPTSA